MDANKIVRIVDLLQKAFPNPQAPLRHRNAFELLLAVILSAQCTDERVNKVTLKLFSGDKATLPEDILQLGEEKVRSLIASISYPNAKSKALIGTAKALLGKEVPSSLEELTALPGVGAKTAQVIQSQWFKDDAFPVDTHVHRVCNRLGLADSGKNRDKTERQVKASVPKKNWSALHLQLIYHGRKTCTARRPKCLECPLNTLCEWTEKTSDDVSKAKPQLPKSRVAKQTPKGK